LQVIDMYWVEHLEAIDYMRASVRLRAYGQRDPLVEFKREGLRLFKQMEQAIARQVIETLKTMEDRVKAPEVLAAQEVHQRAEGLATTDVASQSAGNKVGRNDPCPCGSGKKYKQCHGNNMSHVG
jgi:preprotein translocase subunit SecA